MAKLYLKDRQADQDSGFNTVLFVFFFKIEPQAR